MLSIIDVGPNVIAMAYIPKDAAVPEVVVAKLTRTILRNIPVPQTSTMNGEVDDLSHMAMAYLLTVARFPRMSIKTPKHGTKKKPRIFVRLLARLLW